MKRELVAISAVTLLAQIAAFAKLWLIAQIFGVGADLDGYNLGFILPTLFAGVISGALQTAFFPVYARIGAHSEQKEKEKFERLIFYVVIFVSSILALLLAIFASSVTNLIAADASQAVIEATTYVLPIASVAILLNCISDYFSYLLAFRGRYAIAIVAQVVNALIGVFMLAVWPEGGLLNLTLSTVIGIGMQATICLSLAIFYGFRPFGSFPKLNKIRSEVIEMFHLGSWILPGIIFSNLIATIPLILLSAHGDGAVSAFGYAHRFHQSAIHLIIMAASPVILVHFSEMVERGEIKEIQRLIRKAGWLAILIGSLITLFVWSLGVEILDIIFSAGRFNLDASVRVTEHWIWLSLAIAPLIWTNIIGKKLLAERRAKMASVVTGINLLLLLGAVVILQPVLNEYAIPAAIACSSFVMAFVMWKVTR